MLELIMIVQDNCPPCDIMKGMVPKEIKRYNISFRTEDLDSMPKDIQPEFTPYFFLMSGHDCVEEWGGTSISKFKKVLERNTKKL